MMDEKLKKVTDEDIEQVTAGMMSIAEMVEAHNVLPSESNLDYGEGHPANANA